MTVQIQNLHEYQYSTAHCDLLLAHTQQFKQYLSISHMWVSRYYFCGQYLDIGTDIVWKQKMVENGWYNNFVEDFLNGFSYSRPYYPHFVIWTSQGDTTNDLLSSIYQTCNVSGGFNFFYVHDTYIENFGFATELPLNTLSTTLSPVYEDLIRCLFPLRTHLNETFVKATSYLGYLKQPFTCQLTTSEAINISLPKKITLTIKNTDVMLTIREFECLVHLMQGSTYKDIAYHMNISPRTIEFYFQQIALKTKLNLRQELIPYLKSQGYFNYIKI